MGCIVRGAPRNAANNESDSTRYLPAFTDDMAYITTKKASSSVSRSAYGMAHASWFVWSSCLRDGRRASGFFFMPASVQVALQLRFDGARVLALGDGQHAVDDHFAQLGLPRDDHFELGRHGQEKEVGEADAVHRSREGRGDAMS